MARLRCTRRSFYGFKPSRLEAFRERHLRFRFRKVAYVDPDGGKTSSDIIDKVLGWNQGELATSIDLDWGAYFKHIAFEEEREWRLVLFQWMDDPLNYWVRGSLMIPYLEFDIAQGFDPMVQEIIVGPCAHQRQTAE